MYQVAILGAGISGTILGSILCKAGLKVIILEAKCHPRFAVGESTIPQTSVMMRLMGLKYQFPELINISSYTSLVKVSNTSGVKRNFGYVYHNKDKETTMDTCLQSVIPDLPHGPECHWFRQDIDHYMLQAAVRYGVEIRQNTELVDYRVEDDGVYLETRNGTTIKAEYLVDCSGYKSPVAEKEALRMTDPQLETNTRTVFNHFIDMPPFDHILDSRPRLPRLWFQGTVHHIFKGGWFWVVPFNNTDASKNQLCSVGVCLDRDMYPLKGQDPIKEFYEIAARYPSIHKHFKDAKPTRSWIVTDRLQYNSHSTVGDRYCLMSHSVGFLDPMFARGFVNTMEAIDIISEKLISAFKKDDFSADFFAPLDTYHKNAITYNDRLIAMAYKSFNDYRLWNAAFRVWFTGVTLGVIRLNRHLNKYDQTKDPAYLNVFGPEVKYHGFISPDYERYHQVFMQAKEIITLAANDEAAISQSCNEIMKLLDDSGLCPDIFGISKPNLKFPMAYGLRFFRNIAKWGKKRAPEYVREHYFDYNASSFIRTMLKNRGMKKAVRVTI
ncbi:MAG: NAD(P)/FAD-dependent oxidoreductase [Sinomicrobium sp.]|nr:NAD(P)/FAD-dependent oxidoreductase [Sinomicrobium sp.]